MRVFGVIVMWAMVAALVLCAALWPLARHADRRGRPGLLHSTLSTLRRLTLSTLLALSAVSTISVAHSGKNTNGGTGTTGILPVATGANGYTIPTGGTPVVPVAVTPQDFSNGWRVVEETEAEPFVQPSANAVTNERWRLRGAHDDAFRIIADGWSYSSATGVTVLSRGELRTNIHTHDFPRAFDQDLSLLPFVNWLLLPEGRRESFFWHDVTTSNTLLTTWWNAVLGRDVTNPVNFQAELFPNGMFTYRYEDRTVRHARVWPFDWDDDGLENSVDPDPLTAGPDAHGTNAEWYNIVCSNVFEVVDGGTGPTGILPVGGGNGVPALPWREGVNSNAYYFVDVVAAQGPAPIYFTGDRDSRLGNPVVVALAGVTNRVPLLIGIDYSITSPVPFAVSFPIDYMYPEVTTNDVADYNVCWPLNFAFTEDIGAYNRTYTVTVEPYDPGGVLEWDVNVPMRGGSGGDCGCVNCSGYSASFTCSSTCSCSGGCKARGRYLFEVAEFPVEGGECRCGFDDPPWNYPPTPHNPNDGPSLTIAFSDAAVIFEEAYEDSPGVTKPRRSTRVRLTIDAYGGPNGGTLLLLAQNFANLVKVDGDVLLPYGQQLAAGESFHAMGVFEGVAASEAANDVSVQGSFVEAGTGANIDDDANLTVVRVELKPRVVAPRNNAVYRHTYGVCELVRQIQNPSTPVITWNPVGGGSNEVYAGSAHYRCPLDGCENPLRAEIGSVHYTPLIDVLEPLDVESAAECYIVYSNAVHKGEAGGIGMRLYLYITPFEVSFSEIAVEEVPCLTYEADGYFTNPYFNGAFAHTGGQWGAGAGRWANVDLDNQFGSFDEAAYNAKIPWLTPSGTPTTNVAYAWTDGLVYIDNPFGWHVKDTSGNTPPHKVFGEYIHDTIMLDRHGRVGVWKLNNWVIRTTNDVVTLFGPKEHKQ